MNDSLKKLALDKKLADFCRKNGITCLKTPDFEVHFSPAAILPEKKMKAEAATEYVPVESEFTDDQILFWSSAGIPENNSQGVQ